MRRGLRHWALILWPLCFACGSSSAGGTHADSGPADSGGDGMMTSHPDGAGTDSSGGDAMTTGDIPAPGTSDDVDQNFGDVEPNNTPQQATPLGVAAGADVYVWVNGNSIGGVSNPADYFVFESGPMAGQFGFDICFESGLTGLTATLWKVVDATEQLPPVGTWTASKSCVTDMTKPVALEASTEYLFGLTAPEGVGMYAA